MSILHDKLPCSNSFFRMRSTFRSKLEKAGGLSPASAVPKATIASPAMIRRKDSSASKGLGLAEKNCVNWMDSDDEDDEPESTTDRRAAGAPQIGIAPLEQKKAGLTALKMPKIKDAGDSM